MEEMHVVDQLVDVIGFASGDGAHLGGCANGPAMLEALYGNDLIDGARYQLHYKMVGDNHNASHIELLHHYYNAVLQSVIRGRMPLLVGGDHSMAAASWSAIAKGHKAKQKMGLLWVDAHMDAHTDDTSPSGNIHGMPLAKLLGLNVSAMDALGDQGASIKPEHICLLGIRSFEKGEYQTLSEMGVKIFFMDDVRQYGFRHLFQRALDEILPQVDGFGLTIDIDAFDPQVAPGTGMVEELGLFDNEVLEAIEGLGAHDNFWGFEVAEYDPDHDVENKTSELIKSMINAIFNGTKPS